VSKEQEIMADEKQTPEAPDFTATDSELRVTQLSSYKGNRNVVLVFNRGFF
jgi:peroxiredoxin